MAEVKNAFIKSKMNKDLDSRLIPNGEYRDAKNIQVSRSQGEDVGALENILGNAVTVNGDFALDAGVIATGSDVLTSSITTPLASGTAGTYTPTFTGGSGNGLTLSAVVTNATTVSVNIVSPGTGYAIGDVITINNGQLGSGSQKPVITLKASDFNGGSTYGSTNFELQESEQTRLILKILLYAGIIIRDPQIVQAAASEVQQNEINQKS